MSQRRRPGRPWPAGAELAPSYHLGSDADSSNPDSIFAYLRHAILMGDVEPGAWLRQTELASHFGVSRTPVREALRSLERENLVTIVPNHGARVTPLSLDDFEEIYALREGIEGLAARRAAEACTPAGHERLSARLSELGDLLSDGAVSPYLRAEWQLRLACYRLTDRDRLLATVVHLRDLAERYLRYAYQEARDTRESFEFHRELVAAIGRGDGPGAERVNREALEWTLRRAWPIIEERIASRESELGGPCSSA